MKVPTPTLAVLGNALIYIGVDKLLMRTPTSGTSRGFDEL